MVWKQGKGAVWLFCDVNVNAGNWNLDIWFSAFWYWLVYFFEKNGIKNLDKRKRAVHLHPLWERSSLERWWGNKGCVAVMVWATMPGVRFRFSVVKETLKNGIFFWWIKNSYYLCRPEKREQVLGWILRYYDWLEEGRKLWA